METKAKSPRPVNNTIYDDLGERWYTAHDDPVALLRAEAQLRNPWVLDRIDQELGQRRCSILDIGCGAGFLANVLAEAGHQVTGLDTSPGSLAVAMRHDRSGRVRYDVGDALALPYGDGAFDVVCAMDFLEHIEAPEAAIAEAARVLAPGGLFFFYTFNRNPLAWLVVIKGVEWFVRNTPPDLHVLRLFIKPRELIAMCRAYGLEPVELLGSRPRFDGALWKLLATGVVPDELGFTFTRSTLLAYTGVARKQR